MLQSGKLSAERYVDLLPQYVRQASRERPRFLTPSRAQQRQFHDYFVTHLPSSSLHPDSRSAGLSSRLSKNQTASQSGGKATPGNLSHSRDTTVVRIPLKGARHHFGACVSRGSRPYNEDSHQAGVIDVPAFAKRPPRSIDLDRRNTTLGADSTRGDPQVFYFGVFDGHGGAECSDYLREHLHSYIERTATEFRLKSSINEIGQVRAGLENDVAKEAGKKTLDNLKLASQDEVSKIGDNDGDKPPTEPSARPVIQEADDVAVARLEKSLVQDWKSLVGGYFRRFKPAYFSIYGNNDPERGPAAQEIESTGAAVEEVLTYAFLKADYDFVSAQAEVEARERHIESSDKPFNDDDHMFGSQRGVVNQIAKKHFKGGSTCSVAMVSTPTSTPFWNPATTSSMLVAHVGDTRVLLCSTKTGLAIPMTTDHHPSSPIEATRLRRYAATFVTDSFGEERISGLANTRAFGDIGSKRIGVSAEPEIKRVELGAAEYSFMVLVSDGVSGTLSDQEIVDIVKEAKTPEQASRDVVGFATEVTTEGDNATCLVVRLGGWERRQEGGKGSLGTKEAREFKRQDALDPRSSRR